MKVVLGRSLIPCTQKNSVSCDYIYREQVRVNGFGLFFLALYPGAYVDLHTEHLQVISPLRQLRIYCAGVWHNFILVMAALLLLLVLPVFLMAGYQTGQAVVITSIQPVSKKDCCKFSKIT